MGLTSPISMRSNVPPRARLRRPGLSLLAPVNAPTLYSGSSDSSSAGECPAVQADEETPADAQAADGACDELLPRAGFPLEQDGTRNVLQPADRSLPVADRTVDARRFPPLPTRRNA